MLQSFTFRETGLQDSHSFHFSPIYNPSHLCVVPSLTFAQRLCARRISLARPSLERAGSPQSASVSGLIFCFAAETKKQQHRAVVSRKNNKNLVVRNQHLSG